MMNKKRIRAKDLRPIQRLDAQLKKIEIFDGFMLKIVAATTMLIDHIAVIFVNRMPFDVYEQMRIVGRVSFPIFAFLLVEGFFHTRNRINYLARILGFGIAMIFALAVMSSFGIQVPVIVNIFITLGLGFIAIWVIDYFWDQSKIIAIFCTLGIILFADALHADYGAYGVGLIVLFYCLHGQKTLMTLGFTLLTILSVSFDYMRYEYASFTQLYAIVAVIFLVMYNGEPGKYRFKYFFYFFYPLHFIVLQFIRYVYFGY
jgi:uncharacterized membrane protein YqaE (UPF0057 family)